MLRRTKKLLGGPHQTRSPHAPSSLLSARILSLHPHVETATRLAALRLEAGDLRGASEASELGQAVIPFHDECTALAIQALAASGDRTAALAKYEDYERQAIAQGESVAPEIAKLRNALLRP